MSATAFKERSFDPDALREKYRKERDKRIRSDGNEQYTEVTGDFSRYVDDPYVIQILSVVLWSAPLKCLLLAGVLAVCWPLRGFGIRALTT